MREAADASDFGMIGEGTEAQELLEMLATGVLASEDMPVAEGVAEMRRMEGMCLEPFEVGCCWGVAVAVAGCDNGVLCIFVCLFVG